MCEAPSTCRASTWSMPAPLFWALRRIAAYRGLIAAPGTPKACVTPSRSRIATAAAAAVMRAMSVTPSVVAAPRQLRDELQQPRVVQAAVAACDQRPHELGDHRAERDHHAGL